VSPRRESTRKAAANAGPVCSRGMVLPTTKGRLSVSSPKNTTSEFVASLMVWASESFSS